MKRITALLLLMLPISAMAERVALPAQAAFDKASRLLVSMNAMPTFRDKELLVIKSEPIEVKLTPDQADCGRMFGISYLKDKRTHVKAAYTIRISEVDASTSDVQVSTALEGQFNKLEGSPFFIEKTRDKNEGMLTCTSKGFLESEFLQQLAK